MGQGRDLYVCILTYWQPSEPFTLYTRFLKFLKEDFYHTHIENTSKKMRRKRVHWSSYTVNCKLFWSIRKKPTVTTVFLKLLLAKNTGTSILRTAFRLFESRTTCDIWSFTTYYRWQEWRILFYSCSWWNRKNIPHQLDFGVCSNAGRLCNGNCDFRNSRNFTFQRNDCSLSIQISDSHL